jgi:hypothetical protein
MELPKKLINEFAKVTNDTEKPENDTTVYGVISKNGDSTYVQLDGSDLLTPVSTTTDTQDGDRVTVLIKNHTAIVTGNMTSPAARTDDVKDMDKKFTDENTLITSKIVAAEGDIANLKTDKLSANEAEITYATIVNLNAAEAKIDKLAAIDFDAKYANIDFANVGEAAMEHLYSKSGLIENVTISDGTITGNLVGVTIKGDLIEGNTVVADKLVIKGTDGLYYKLNTDGMKIEAQQTDYNSLNGSIITAKSITATKISVDDLVAFDATIGGFNITSDALYSGVKESINNTTRGIYLGKDGQLAIGDSNNFLKYYKTTSGAYKLELSLGGDDITTSVNDAINTANGAANTANNAVNAANDAANAANDAANTANDAANTANDAANTANDALDTANGALSAVGDAAKTATNFLSYDSSNGLQLGNKSGGYWNGYRTQITSNKFNILDSSGNAVASYGSNLIELGKNSTNSEVSFCNNKGTVSYISDRYGNGLEFSSDRLSLKSDNITLMSNETTSSGVERTWFYVGADSIIASVQSSSGSGATSGAPYFQMMNTGSDNSLRLEAGDAIILSASIIHDTNGFEFLSVDRGYSGTWEYRKWSNGDVELWGYQTVTSTSCSTPVGSMYRTVEYAPPSFPFTVYSPNLTAFYESDSGGYGGFYWPTSNTTTSKPPNYYIMRPNSSTIHGKVNFHVYGKWKT